MYSENEVYNRTVQESVQKIGTKTKQAEASGNLSTTVRSIKPLDAVT